MRVTGKPNSHPAAPVGKVGVLLINLGTPDAPTPAAVRRYLAEFLSDPRVVEIPRWVWKPILHGIILRTRPAKSAHAYAQVWGEQGSPLAAITAGQAQALQPMLPHVRVDWAMRYGHPSIADKLDAMKAAGCDRILIASLYPQYSGATTASVVDKVADALRAMRWQPSLRTLPPYYDRPAHIAALARSVRDQLAALDFIPDVLLASYHGMPQRTHDLGDPYYCHCAKTTRLLSEALGMPVQMSFQSRFGRAKWLEPATDTVLAALPDQGARKVALIAPGFSADCLETLEELAIRGRADFLAAGGSDFAYLSCLNHSEIGITMLRDLVTSELAGWA